MKDKWDEKMKKLKEKLDKKCRKTPFEVTDKDILLYELYFGEKAGKRFKQRVFVYRWRVKNREAYNNYKQNYEEASQDVMVTVKLNGKNKLMTFAERKKLYNSKKWKRRKRESPKISI